MTPLLLPALLLLLAHRAAGQVFFKGECPDPPTVVDFKLWLFEGTWYETQRWYSIREKGHCVRHTFTDLGYGTLDVLTEMNLRKSYEYRRGLAQLSVSKSKGYGYDKHSYGQTKYTINYDDRKGEKGDSETFFVLDTDYWTYAIIWSCSGKKLFNMQYLRILTRSPYPHSHTLVKVYRELEYLGLDQQHLTLVDDKQECRYQVAQTHRKKGYGHGHGKGGGKSRPLPRPAYPISYTSLLSEVKPGGGQGGGLDQTYQYEPVGGYGQTGYSGTDAVYEEVGGGYGGGELLSAGGSAGGYAGTEAVTVGQGYSGGGGYSAGGGDGYSGGGASYPAGVAGEGYSEDISLGYSGGGGGEAYSSGGYSGPSGGYSTSGGSSDLYSGGVGSGGSSYTTYSQSGGGKY